jgi:hypothetical protein
VVDPDPALSHKMLPPFTTRNGFSARGEKNQRASFFLRSVPIRNGLSDKDQASTTGFMKHLG